MLPRVRVKTRSKDNIYFIPPHVYIDQLRANIETKTLCAITFVSVDEIVDVFEILFDSELFPLEVQSIINYFDVDWTTT